MAATPILLLVPYRYKAAVLYSQVPTSSSASGDFVVSRALDTASRITSNGNIETSVSANIARINYPRTGISSGCPGLLIEPAATNILLESQTLSVTGTWSAVSATVSANVGTAPDGSSTADRITFDGTSVESYVAQAPDLTITSGITYTISCFVKNGTFTSGSQYFGMFAYKDGNTSVELDIRPADPSNPFIQVNGAPPPEYITGTAYREFPTSKAEYYGNDWWRYSLTFTPSATYPSGGTRFQFYANGFTLASASPHCLIWGCQVESGSVATSYIPTTTGSVTRNKDVITNSTFVIPNLIGSILTEFESPVATTYFVDNLPVSISVGYNKVLVSYTPTTITVFRNGSQVSGSPFSPPGGVLPILGNVINMGHNNQYYQIGGNMKSLALYSTTLSTAEASGLTI